jgi:hypothetical protein
MQSRAALSSADTGGFAQYSLVMLSSSASLIDLPAATIMCWITGRTFAATTSQSFFEPHATASSTSHLMRRDYTIACTSLTIT